MCICHVGLPNFHYLLDLDLQYNGLLKAKFSLFSLFARFRFAVQRTLKSQIFPKGRLSYHLFVKYFSQLSFDSEMYTKSATATAFVYISESNESFEKYLTQR